MIDPIDPDDPQDGSFVADYDFDLPEELIAQQPPAERGTSRMLVLNRKPVALLDRTVDYLDRPMATHTQPFADRSFADLPSLLNPGDLLILNDSRVIPARLVGRRVTSRGMQEPTAPIEILLTSPAGAGNWNALVRPGKKVRTGDRLEFAAPNGAIVLEAEVLSSGDFGERLLRFTPFKNFFQTLDQIGHMPLPPYIKRPGHAELTEDRERYQTVFAAERGSVAAPTAGLHFTPEMLAAIANRGVEIARLTLHVGLGTFAPLRVDRLDQIHLHRERYTLPTATADALNRAQAERRRIVAVGTTTVRTLEHCALIAAGKPLAAHSSETEIFISPGFQFRIVGAMLTNFHLPQSSLLMLVSAFAGREQVLAAYAHAVRQKYHFFSYGDCMFIQ
jgi:S-adenosylmethionine:tRNA ribosyltransferase-isomerase